MGKHEHHIVEWKWTMALTILVIGRDSGLLCRIQQARGSACRRLDD